MHPRFFRTVSARARRRCFALFELNTVSDAQRQGGVVFRGAGGARRRSSIRCPAYLPATEWRQAPLATQYPLELLARKADNYMNSTFANLKGHQAMEAAHANLLEMHAVDAKARGIRDGDAVEIENARGKLGPRPA